MTSESNHRRQRNAIGRDISSTICAYKLSMVSFRHKSGPSFWMHRFLWSILAQEVFSESLHGGEGLDTGLFDLGGWEEEAVSPGISQLHHVGVLGSQYGESPILTASRSGI